MGGGLGVVVELIGGVTGKEGRMPTMTRERLRRIRFENITNIDRRGRNDE